MQSILHNEAAINRIFIFIQRKSNPKLNHTSHIQNIARPKLNDKTVKFGIDATSSTDPSLEAMLMPPIDYLFSPSLLLLTLQTLSCPVATSIPLL
jgi:hypothetical protein